MKISLQLPAKGQYLKPRSKDYLFGRFIYLEATDYAVLNGAAPNRFAEGCWLEIKQDLLDKLPPSMTKDELLQRDIFGRLGVDNVKPTHRNPSVAPMLDFSGFKNNLLQYAEEWKLEKLDIYHDRIYPEMLVTQFGMYPQSLVAGYSATILERYFALGKLVQSNAVYTVDGAVGNEPFKPIQNKAYVMDNKLYVRAVAAKNNAEKFSNGQEIITGRGYWFNVEPVCWMMETKDDTKWISQFGLLSGLQFDNKDDYKGDNLESTTIYKFMQEYMLPEMLQTWDFEGCKEDYNKRKRKVIEEKIEKELQKSEQRTDTLKQRLRLFGK